MIVCAPLRGFVKNFITMRSFSKFYVMGSPEIDLFDIAHVKVKFIPVLKIYTIPILKLKGLPEESLLSSLF